MGFSNLHSYEKCIVSFSNNCIRNHGASVCVADFVGCLFTLHIVFENLFASVSILFVRKYLDVNTKLILCFPTFGQKLGKARICRKCKQVLNYRCNCKIFRHVQNVFCVESFRKQLCSLFHYAASNTDLYYSRSTMRLSFGGTECAMNQSLADPSLGFACSYAYYSMKRIFNNYLLDSKWIFVSVRYISNFFCI